MSEGFLKIYGENVEDLYQQISKLVMRYGPDAEKMIAHVIMPKAAFDDLFNFTRFRSELIDQRKVNISLCTRSHEVKPFS